MQMPQMDSDGHITPGSVPTVYVPGARTAARRRVRNGFLEELASARARIEDLEELVAALSDKLADCAEKLARRAEKK